MASFCKFDQWGCSFGLMILLKIYSIPGGPHAFYGPKLSRWIDR